MRPMPKMRSLTPPVNTSPRRRSASCLLLGDGGAAAQQGPEVVAVDAADEPGDAEIERGAGADDEADAEDALPDAAREHVPEPALQEEQCSPHRHGGDELPRHPRD